MMKLSFNLLDFKLWLTFIGLIVLFKHADAAVSIRSGASAVLGSSVTLICDIYDETNMPNAIFWSRSLYNGSSLVNYIGTAPPGSTVSNLQINATYYTSTLRISNVTSSDYATFGCMSQSYVNITQKFIIYESYIDPLTLCENGTYNSVLYAFLLISNVFLGGILIFIAVFLWRDTVPKTVSPTNSNVSNAKSATIDTSTGKRVFEVVDVAIAFGCIVGSILFTILMLIFWISPTYAAPSGSTSYIYYSAVIIVVAAVVATFILWGGILYFVIKNFIQSLKRVIDIVTLVVFSVMALIHLILILTIICSVAYCTGGTKLPMGTNYSVANVVCAVLSTVLIILLAAYIFWLFMISTDKLRSIGILDKFENLTSRNKTDKGKKQAGKKDLKVENLNETARSTKSETPSTPKGKKRQKERLGSR